MAAIVRAPDDAVVVSGSVFRALIDLSLEAPDLEKSLIEWFGQVRDVKGISLNLLDPEIRAEVVSALHYGVSRGMQGERAEASGEDCATGDRLVLGAEKVWAFLDSALEG
jgi:hypothetical protein